MPRVAAGDRAGRGAVEVAGPADALHPRLAVPEDRVGVQPLPLAPEAAGDLDLVCPQRPPDRGWTAAPARPCLADDIEYFGFLADEDGDAVRGKGRPGRCVPPSCRSAVPALIQAAAGGQVDIAGAGARLQDRGDEQVRAEHELVVDVPGCPGRRGSPRTAAASAAAPSATPRASARGCRAAAARAARSAAAMIAGTASSPYDHTSFGPPVIVVAGRHRAARRSPCSRNSGQNTPYWNQRTISSR